MKKLIFILSAIFANFSQAAPNTQLYASPIPFWCVDGSWQSGSISFDGSLGGDYEYLKAEISNYVLINEPIRVKGDGKYAIAYNDTIYFYDSIGGFRGKADADFEGNAYLTYTPSTQHPLSSIGYIWVMKNLENIVIGGPVTNPNGLVPPCSKKQVHFQYRPILNKVSYNAAQGNVTLYYELDTNSKSIVENINSPISIKWRHTISGKSGLGGPFYVNAQRGTITVPVLPGGVSEKGVYQLTATINDGTYPSNDLDIGTYSTPCNSGKTATVQVSSNQPTLDTSALCGGAHCGYTVQQSGYPLPTLKYTCN